MFELLRKTIIGPNPCPFPPKWDTRDILLLAILYLLLLILTKGVAPAAAFGMASSKYGISETVLRKAAEKYL